MLTSFNAVSSVTLPQPNAKSKGDKSSSRPDWQGLVDETRAYITNVSTGEMVQLFNWKRPLTVLILSACTIFAGVLLSWIDLGLNCWYPT